jgi:branched-subunit amino acid transport protein
MNDYLLIVGMGICVFLPRFLPFVLFKNRSFPPKVKEILDFVPPAVLAAFVVPGLIYPDPHGSAQLWLDNRYLVAGLLAFMIGIFSKRVLLACFISSVVFFILPWLFSH